MMKGSIEKLLYLHQERKLHKQILDQINIKNEIVMSSDK